MSAEQMASAASATATGQAAGPLAASEPGARPDERYRTLGAATRAPRRSHLRRNLKRFLIDNRLNLLGVILVAVFLFCAAFGEWIVPHDPYAPNTALDKAPPSWDHWLGTDELGRDVFSRIVVGARISLRVAFVVLAFAVVVGTVVGAIAGYFGGWVDEVLMRLTDLFLAFPALILAVAVAATLGRDLNNTMIALSTVFWPWYARLVRAQVLSIRERDFVTAARSVGLSPTRLLLRHVLPNAASIVIIQLTLDIGYAVLSTSALSFIGLGAQPPNPEWGTMLSDARNSFRDAWWYSTFPGVALTLTVFAFNVLGDGLQEALDPRSSRR